MNRRARRVVRVTRDWVITVVALTLLVLEWVFGERNPAVLTVFAGLAIGPHAVRRDLDERRRELERDAAE